jgi:mono/diheme cytochrome c family protein
MSYRYLQTGIAAAAVLLVALAGCGGGGNSAGDTYPDSVPLGTVTGPNSFLTFPNPIINASGVSEIDSAEYTEAYYRAIDPNNDRDTYAKWKAVNGFDSGSGVQITVVVGDSRDLGYGRYITARKNNDGTMAFSVRNYLVPAAAGYGYSTLNLDAAIARDERWYIGASNIEFSPGPNGGVPFAKFYFFAPNGSRANAVNLDGRGVKAMPGPCISCHGGRGDPLTPPNASGQRLFPLVMNSASLTRGDVQAHFHPLEPDNFEFSTQAGYTRPDQEAAIKTLNTWILQSYPLPFGTTVPASGVDASRRVANPYEWQGIAASALVKDGYGGYDGNGELLNASYVDATPTGWSSVGQTSLYQNVVVPSCRVCHVLRGAGSQSANTLSGTDIDLDSYAKFNSYADQIKAHTIDRGNMPLAKIHYQKYWSTPSIYESMADFLTGAGYTVRDGSGAVLRPGRPIADAGPNRVMKQGATTLSGIASMYATSYQWSIASAVPGTATLSNDTSRDATFTATADGTYVAQLVVSDGMTTSDPSQVTIVVNNALTPVPSAIRFADIKAVLQNPVSTCTLACHTAANLNTVAFAPFVYNNVDRNGDTVVDATDDAWMYAEVRARINFLDPADSALLLKPSTRHHGGKPVASDFLPNFDSSLAPGAAGRANYDLFLNWILNGAPQ